jgi:hypothetical protein
VRQQVSENGPPKQGGNSLFLQGLCGMNRLSEKVHFAGLTALWPGMTRIPNIPLFVGMTEADARLAVLAVFPEIAGYREGI